MQRASFHFEGSTMSYVPVEKVTSVVKNKYEAVVVAAREQPCVAAGGVA